MCPVLRGSRRRTRVVKTRDEIPQQLSRDLVTRPEKSDRSEIDANHIYNVVGEIDVTRLKILR